MVPTVRKKYDSYHETVVTVVIRQLLLAAEADEVRCQAYEI